MKSYNLDIRVSLGRSMAGLFAAGSVYAAALLVTGNVVTVEGVVGVFVLAFALGVDDMTVTRGE